MNPDLREVLRKLGPEGLHDMLTPEERAALPFMWELWARPASRVDDPKQPRTYRGQVPPETDPPWSVCLFLGGRGTGKTRSLAEWCRSKAEGHPGCRINLVGRDMGEARKVATFGESGVMSICPPWNKPTWSPVDAALRWANGSQLFLYSAEAPTSLRGPQCHYLACDELAAWNKYRPETAWNLAVMGCRLGLNPQAFIATTPTPSRLLRDIRDRESTIVLVGSMDDNEFLPAGFVQEMDRVYSGTSFGRQELDGILLDQADGALFNLAVLERWRVPAAPKLARIVVSADPSASEAREHDEAGVIVLGLGVDTNCYVLDDLSGVMTPHGWAEEIIKAFHNWRAGYVLAESQRGGKMVKTIINTTRGGERIPVRPVPAQLAKETRAQPVAAATERGAVRLVGRLDDLERELCTWVPRAGHRSPGRMDAFVHGVLDMLMLGGPTRYVSTAGEFPRRL